LGLDDALALGDDQNLVEGMAVHLVHRTILKRHDADPNLRGLLFADQTLPLDLADE
jgi:hypothetical protein